VDALEGNLTVDCRQREDSLQVHRRVVIGHHRVEGAPRHGHFDLRDVLGRQLVRLEQVQEGLARRLIGAPHRVTLVGEMTP
jgi:hypothetical protein